MTMTDERTNNGRRQSDALFSRGVKIFGISGTFALAALAMGFRLYAQMQDYPALQSRVTAVETAQADQKASLATQLMMTCVLYQDAHPTTVPALCDQAIRRSQR